MSKTCAEAFDELLPTDRIDLLISLGFEADDLESSRLREEIDLRYNCLFYDVQDELRKCYIKGEWRHPETKAKIKP